MKKTLLPLLVAFLATPLSAALVITDGSFENGLSDPFGNSPSFNYSSLYSWFEESGNGDGALREVAQNENANTSNIPAADAGTYWANISTVDATTSIYQSLGTLGASDPAEFTISGLLGQRSNRPFSNVTLEFYTDITSTPADGNLLTGTLLDSIDLGNPFTEGVAGTQAFLETFSVASASVGDEIWLRIVASPLPGDVNAQNLIDDLAVLEVIPEPSVIALFGAGLLVLVLIRRRRG